MHYPYKDALQKSYQHTFLQVSQEYSKTGHGGNKSLEALCTKDPQYHVKNFQWTILEVLPLNVAPLVAIERESFYKKKFGTAEPNGYNNN